MRFAFSSNAFSRTSLKKAIKAIASAGYEGIEIMADEPHAWPPSLSAFEIRQIRRAVSSHGLAVANINSFTMRAAGSALHPSWIGREVAERLDRIAHTARCIELAAALDSPTVSTEPGGPLDGMDPNEALGLFHEGLMAVERVAMDNGVRVLIEPEPGLLIETGDEFASFFAALNPDVFGLNFDVGHLFCMGADCASEIKRFAPVTFHYHLEDIPADRSHRHLMPGEGAIDFGPVLKAIASTGFDGFVTVELYNHDGDPAGAAAKALSFLKGQSEVRDAV